MNNLTKGVLKYISGISGIIVMIGISMLATVSIAVIWGLPVEASLLFIGNIMWSVVIIISVIILIITIYSWIFQK